jgi:hypothetical protein
MSVVSPYRAFVMAMQRVEERLRKVCAALDASRIPYAVCGGNAVAAWIATVDPGATRTTKDVDVLVNRSDLERITATLEDIGFVREDLRSITLFVDPNEPNRKTGVHLIWAGERVRPSYVHAAPTPDEAVRIEDRFAVLSVAALVRMKLTSLRDIDRVHVADLKSAGLIDEQIHRVLPADLRERLDRIVPDDPIE